MDGGGVRRGERVSGGGRDGDRVKSESRGEGEMEHWCESGHLTSVSRRPRANRVG